MATINVEPAWFVAQVTAMKRKHPFTVSASSSALPGPSSLSGSSVLTQAANVEKKRAKTRELLASRILAERNERAAKVAEGEVDEKEIKEEFPSEPSASVHELPSAVPSGPISPETKNILELVQMLHQKIQGEEQQQTIEQVDRSIDELQRRIAQLTTEKHELGFESRGNKEGARGGEDEARATRAEPVPGSVLPATLAAALRGVAQLPSVLLPAICIVLNPPFSTHAPVRALSASSRPRAPRGWSATASGCLERRSPALADSSTRTETTNEHEFDPPRVNFPDQFQPAHDGRFCDERRSRPYLTDARPSPDHYVDRPPPGHYTDRPVPDHYVDRPGRFLDQRNDNAAPSHWRNEDAPYDRRFSSEERNRPRWGSSFHHGGRGPPRGRNYGRDWRGGGFRGRSRDRF